MKNTTRKLFNAYLDRIAGINGVAREDASAKFAVAPVVEQRLVEKIKQSSEFLSQINMIGVDQQEDVTLGLGVTRPLAGRTNTAAGNRRTPTDPTDSSQINTYRCVQTNFDWARKYALIDQWAHRPDFQIIMSSAIQKQEGRDHIMIGWNGTSVAAATDRVANPLLQDVNKGWLYQIRTNAPERVLNDGALTANPTKAVYVDASGDIGVDVDYANLDAVVYDAVQLLAEWHRDDTDLVAIIGRDLLHDKFLNVINAAGDKATEMEARDRILTLPKMVGGKRAIVVPFFPANAVLVTSLDNLSIYLQNGTRRRMLKDEPELDQIANYESVNVAYVVEDYERVALVENIVMGKKPAAPAN
ncbi:MAG: capsid protein [Proteobacteria bacterium SG_bin5]|nr:phage major capsid protein, P2 family [Sphingomonas sp.]OQW42098.1 MAG: capsid protein [Proteobacteria bacterium SG_bin5]